MSRWHLGVVAHVHWHRCAGASALTTLSRWRIGVVALVHAGIVALRLAVLTRTRARMTQAKPIFWRTHHIKSDPKSMLVMHLCLWGV
jgi:hypothetical protein